MDGYPYIAKMEVSTKDHVMSSNFITCRICNIDSIFLLIKWAA